jgi:hypothetical protein
VSKFYYYVDCESESWLCGNSDKNGKTGNVACSSIQTESFLFLPAVYDCKDWDVQSSNFTYSLYVCEARCVMLREDIGCWGQIPGPRCEVIKGCRIRSIDQFHNVCSLSCAGFSEISCLVLKFNNWYILRHSDWGCWKMLQQHKECLELALCVYACMGTCVTGAAKLCSKRIWYSVVHSQRSAAL